MMYWLYSFGFSLALIASAPWWLLRASRAGKYRAGFAQRIGRLSATLRPTAPGEDCIWIHAVSVGEVMAVAGLAEELRRLFPESRLVLSTTTQAGQKLARQRYGDSSVFYFPLDLAFCIRPYLKRLRPRLVILAETEFWPNFLRLSKESGSQVAVVNARISDRSFPGYRRWRSWLGKTLAKVDIFLAQSEEDRRRLTEIGVPRERVMVTGNLKFDQAAPAITPFTAQLRRALPAGENGPVIVCGSTLEGEEEMLLAAFQSILSDFPEAVMIIAPRHPERFQGVADLIAGRGFTLWRRSRWQGAGDAPLAGGVMLLDSIGELAGTYSLAKLAFVGGSLVAGGGHNILEPARYGLPIVVGEHTENFRDIMRLFVETQAIEVIHAESCPITQVLTSTLRGLLQDASRRQTLGNNAAAIFARHAGAARRTAQALQSLENSRRDPTRAKAAAEPLSL
jgi:3-deoxy-D-manno-octulosonic-acid transferase